MARPGTGQQLAVDTRVTHTEQGPERQGPCRQGASIQAGRELVGDEVDSIQSVLQVCGGQ